MDGSKILVWRGLDPAKDVASPLHSRLITPEFNGVSKEYNFHPSNGHTLVVDEADAAVLLSGPDKAEFRIQA